MFRFLVLLLASFVIVLLPECAFAQSQQKFQYTYCSVMGYTPDNTHKLFTFSAPFPAVPDILPGESKDDARSRRHRFYSQASDEFEAYLVKVGIRQSDPDCNNIGNFMPSPGDTVDEATKNALSIMRSVNSSNTTKEPRHTDFVPSWAGQMSGGAPVKPATSGGNGITLSDGPTPADLAKQREDKAAAARRQQQEEIEHAQKIQQAFEKAQQAEAMKIKARADEMRRDYDRRRDACRTGDKVNCYSKVSEQ